MDQEQPVGMEATEEDSRGIFHGTITKWHPVFIPDVTDSDLGVETDYPDRLLAVIRGSTAKYCDSNFNQATAI